MFLYRRVRTFGIGVGLAILSSVAALAACTSDESGGASPEEEDASPDVTVPDSATSSDAGVSDSGSPSDGGAEASAPTVSTTYGATGMVTINEAFVVADFFEDDAIVRATDAPSCVVTVRSFNKQRSSAGTLTIGGGLVGQAGGPPTPVTLAAIPDPDPGLDNMYYTFLDEPPSLYVNDFSGLSVQVELEGTSSIPSLPVTTIATPTTSLTIDEPTFVDGGTHVEVSSASGFDVKWTVADAGASAGQQVLLEITTLTGETSASRIGELRCVWPAAQGKGVVSAALLAALKAQLGLKSTEAALGLINLTSGGTVHSATNGASFIVTATYGQSTTGYTISDITIK